MRFAALFRSPPWLTGKAFNGDDWLALSIYFTLPFLTLAASYGRFLPTSPYNLITPSTTERRERRERDESACCSEGSGKRCGKTLSELKNTLLSIHEATQTPPPAPARLCHVQGRDCESDSDMTKPSGDEAL